MATVYFIKYTPASLPLWPQSSKAASIGRKLGTKSLKISHIPLSLT
jgi:hypothetical protein